jgi:hypothetical protein
MSGRRGFLLGLGAALAAPAIVRAESLMRVAQISAGLVRQPIVASIRPNSLLSVTQITREAVRLFLNSNVLLKAVDRQYDLAFALAPHEHLRVRLPDDYREGAAT